MFDNDLHVVVSYDCCYVAIDCGSPGILRHGFLSGERFDYPNIIAFYCHDGYELIGKDSTRACQENGLWSGSMPFCQSNYLAYVHNHS
jgi:1,4-alpha-glucan branching enzyme